MPSKRVDTQPVRRMNDIRPRSRTQYRHYRPSDTSTFRCRPSSLLAVSVLSDLLSFSFVFVASIFVDFCFLSKLNGTWDEVRHRRRIPHQPPSVFIPSSGPRVVPRSVHGRLRVAWTTARCSAAAHARCRTRNAYPSMALSRSCMVGPVSVVK